MNDLTAINDLQEAKQTIVNGGGTIELNGVIRYRGSSPTVIGAVNYLVDEWDYHFERPVMNLLVRFEWKLQDMWVGLFWKRSARGLSRTLDVWICLLPCVPLHITYTRK